jgi:predicted transglutaminase-like cysteine proteinase
MRCRLAAVAPASCAGPSVLEQINADVNNNHPYIHCAKRDFRELNPGEGGNCAAIAETKRVEPARRGISGALLTYHLTTGEGHAFLVTDAGVLDNRFDQVVSYAEVGCE